MEGLAAPLGRGPQFSSFHRAILSGYVVSVFAFDTLRAMRVILEIRFIAQGAVRPIALIETIPLSLNPANP